MRYAVAGRSAATVATVGDTIAALWNPAGSLAVTVYSFGLQNPLASGAQIYLRRTTTKGTPGSTVTPDADNHYSRKAVDPAAAVLDLGAYSVQPTADGNSLIRLGHQHFIGAGYGLELPVPIIVPAGTGLALQNGTAAVNQSDVWFEYDAGGGHQGDAFYLSSAADALAAGESVWGMLWNPSSTAALKVFYIGFNNRTVEAVDYGVTLRRATTRGTIAGSGNASSIEAHVGRRYGGVAARVDGGFSAEPTLGTSVLFRWQLSGRGNMAGISWTVPIDDENGIDLNDCIVVPALTGLAVVRDTTGATSNKDLTFGWFE